MKVYKFPLSKRALCNVYLLKGKYQNNQNSLQIINRSNDDPLLTVSICVPGLNLKNDELVIKNYSENEGILEFLIENEIAELTNRYVQIGYIDAPIVKLLVSDKI
ncbi:hypothetical protein [Aquirufa aurantiipilula]|uniref:hypothetical protein n=1 Tax=Aquirufa aurantiipilula TaxID=2696561 RepID=UPI001CAA6116|nr:hypothetical protein [Aquirufa aurantiipilula]MBZ1326998.1 DUF4313 domain-containing protein [Aquirufa aurantiipilula]